MQRWHTILIFTWRLSCGQRERVDFIPLFEKNGASRLAVVALLGMRELKEIAMAVTDDTVNGSTRQSCCCDSMADGSGGDEMERTSDRCCTELNS
jgi:hypothetical protein